MNAPAAKIMTVDEFLVWSEGQTDGRYELHGGVVVRLQSERAGHRQRKYKITRALDAGIVAAGLSCHVEPDGAVVRIDAHTAFEPDALVYCGPALPEDSIEVPNPVIVVEVLSPDTAAGDKGVKLAGYFSRPSIAHYLIIDPVGRMLTHHYRAQSGEIAVSEIGGGRLLLAPPGLTLDVDAVLGA